MQPRFEIVTVTPPTAEPFDLAAAKDQLRLGSGANPDDAYVTGLISVSRDRAEKHSNRYFTDQVIKIIYFGPFPTAANSICLPFPDLVSVDEITYIDADNTTQTVSNSDYSFDSDTRMIYNNGTGWPAAQQYKVEVTTAPPEEFEGAIQAMLMMLTDMYENRTESIVGTIVAENPAVKAALAPYRVNIGI